MTQLFAQAPVIPAKKLDPAPKIDGVIEDSEWKGAAKFSGLVDANNGGAAPESGTFWLGYDEKFIYFAARLTDAQPGSVRATEYRTNVGLPGDDYVELDVDLSGSLSDFSTFQANPRGATNISITGGRALKREWLGEIFAQGRVTATGWDLEMRVPWKILPVPKAGPRDIRINVQRLISRLNRNLSFTYTGPGLAQLTPIWKDVIIPKAMTDRSIKLLPYVYGGADASSGAIADAGLDSKTSLTDQVQLVGTVNPDFRNVENAILNLDFSRFARLAQETRPFFLEGSQYMNSQLYASQTIPRLDVGVNTYGKLNDQTQFGFINAYWQGRENDAILNTSYNPTPNDSWRLTATQKIASGDQNDAYLVRYNKQFGPWSIFLRDMGSQDTNIGRGNDDTGSLTYVKGEWFGGAQYDRAMPNFAPALGFFPEVDYKGFSEFAGFDHPMNKGPLQDYNANFNNLDYTRVSGMFYRRDPTVNGGVTTRNGINLNVTVDRPDFEGSHDRIDTYAINYPNADTHRNFGLSYSGGEIGGQVYNNIALSTAYRPFRAFQFNATYQHVHLGTDQDQAILTGFYDLGADRSVSGRAVQTGGHTNFYLALRRSGNQGAEYYLIVGDPNALSFRSSVILKVVVPFRV